MFATLAAITFGSMCVPLPNDALHVAAVQTVHMQELRGSLSVGISTPLNFSFGQSLGPESPAVPLAVASGPNATLYRWASVSKTLVGLVAAQLASSGVVDLDADVLSTYYPHYQRPTEYLACADGQPAAVRWPGNAGVNTNCLRSASEQQRQQFRHHPPAAAVPPRRHPALH